MFFSDIYKHKNNCIFNCLLIPMTWCILLPGASGFGNFCYLTISYSAALAADEECTQLKESWISTKVSICFHFDPQDLRWKHRASAKTIFETSAFK